MKRSKKDASRKSTINLPLQVNIPSLSLVSSLTWARLARSSSCRTWLQWINSWRTLVRVPKMSRLSWLSSRRPWNANSQKRSPLNTRIVRVSTLSLKRTATSSSLRGGPSVTRPRQPLQGHQKLKIQRTPKLKSRLKNKNPQLKKSLSRWNSLKFRRKSRKNLILWLPRSTT